METVNEYERKDMEKLSAPDKTLVLFARLMEGGQDDSDTVQDLDGLTKLLHDDIQEHKTGDDSICGVIDGDCVDTLLQYLDMRQSDTVRGHATLATSNYLKAAGEDGSKYLRAFFLDRVKRGTYDDYIVAFCVAAITFPIVPELTTELFLSEGFLPSLGPLMDRKWKSRKVETACLEMLNAACMNGQCREAVQKYCLEWLERIVDKDPDEAIKEVYTQPDTNGGPAMVVEDLGSISMRRHSTHVKHLAAVILAKLRAIQTVSGAEDAERVQQASSTMEDLSKWFSGMLVKDPEHSRDHSIEGLAYATLRPNIKEDLSKDKPFLRGLKETLRSAAPKSPLTYGALTILVNLTQFMPAESEEKKRMKQLKAYANAAGKVAPDPLNDNEHASERCKRVFEAGFVPVLVSHSKHGSTASLGLIINVLLSLSMVSSLRSRLAQQGTVTLLITAWNLTRGIESRARHTAAQALSRILISTNPGLVFGREGSTPQRSAIRPLVGNLKPDASEQDARDLLPVFEALMALTNLASTDDDTRKFIVRLAWPDIEELTLSSNPMIQKAAVELICNLVPCVEAIALYADGSIKAADRLHILLALADAEDAGVRSAAGGALATLSSVEEVVKAILKQPKGCERVLGLCADEEQEGLRHRGAVVVGNMVTMEGELGKEARKALKEADGVDVLTECAKMSRSSEVVETVVQALKGLLEE